MNRNGAGKLKHLPIFYILLYILYFLLIFPETNFVAAHFQGLFGRSDCDAFLENEGKIHEEGYVKEIFS